MEITQEFLKQMFYYKDGILYWKANRTGKAKKGTVAGSKHPSGYRQIKIYSQRCLIHRLIFLMHHGYLPEFIDHINGIKNDNRVENLRAATKSQNLYNCGLPKNNTTGYKNVYFNKRKNKWFVTIHADKKAYFFGYFTTKEEAAIIARQERQKFHKDFTNHG